MLFASIVIVAMSNKEPESESKNPVSDVNLDKSIKPQEDFYAFANGGWMKSHPIPKEEASFSVFNQLRDETKENVRVIIENVAKAKHQPGTPAQKVGDFYSSAMDIETINKKGIQPIKPFLERIAKISSKKDIEEELIFLHKHAYNPLFSFSAMTDFNNSSMRIGVVWQGGTSLPDRDYYLEEGEYFQNIRQKYSQHIKNMFALSGKSEEEAKKAAGTVMKIETKLAKNQLSRIELRSPDNINNPGNIDSLEKYVPAIDWDNYFSSRGITNPQKINLGQPGFLSAMNIMLEEIPVEEWKNYFEWYIISRNASLLSEKFVQEDFEFFNKTLTGSQQIRPRWKRMVETTNSILGEAVGEIYVKKHFSEEAKQEMTDLVLNLKKAMKERIKDLAWMGEETKEKALEKLTAMTFMIGYPEKFEQYEGLEISKDDFFTNIMNARQWHVEDGLSKLWKPVDRKEWPLNAQQVNAGYMPNRNQVVFPAGILQPPLFGVSRDIAMNYGAIGMIIGHEMTHGFDDKGRLYDKIGNLNSWWTDDDAKRFKERSQVLVDQYNQFVIVDSLHANGELSLGENIADLGGLNIAFTAFQMAKENHEVLPAVNGFDPDQRFFLSYAHVWAQNIRDEEKIRLTKQDVHSLGRNRVIGPLRNMPEFHAAFDVNKGDFMYLNENERAFIW